MKKKKIVHVAQSAGGVAQYLYMLLSNMDKSEYENVLICSHDYKPQIQRFKNITEKIYFIDMVREINIKKDFKAIMELRKIIKKEAPDTIYMHSSKAGAIGRISLLFYRKINKLYNAHGWYFNAEIGKKKKSIFTIIEKILAWNTDIIVNISNNEYESALKNKIAKKQKMCIIENGIDFREINTIEKSREIIRKKYKILDSEVVIGVVGRITEQKDPLTFIKAAREISDKLTNVKFMFVGSGELEEKVKTYATENNFIENVIITGWVNNAKEYIAAFDIAVLPSKWEGFGLAIIEYMACKKPIIATRVGGIQDIIKNEDYGILVDSGDEHQLSNAILQYLNKENKIKNMIENNYAYSINKYNIKNTVEKHKKFF